MAISIAMLNYQRVNSKIHGQIPVLVAWIPMPFLVDFTAWNHIIHFLLLNSCWIPFLCSGLPFLLTKTPYLHQFSISLVCLKSHVCWLNPNFSSCVSHTSLTHPCCFRLLLPLFGVNCRFRCRFRWWVVKPRGRIPGEIILEDFTPPRGASQRSDPWFPLALLNYHAGQSFWNNKILPPYWWLAGPLGASPRTFWGTIF